MLKPSTVLRFTKTVRASETSANVEFGAVYLQPLRSHMDPEHYVTHTDDDGAMFYETTWGMTAEVRVSRALFERGAWETKVSQSAIGAMTPEQARVRAQLMLKACDYAETVAELIDETIARGVDFDPVILAPADARSKNPGYGTEDVDAIAEYVFESPVGVEV